MYLFREISISNTNFKSRFMRRKLQKFVFPKFSKLQKPGPRQQKFLFPIDHGTVIISKKLRQEVYFFLNQRASLFSKSFLPRNPKGGKK